MTIAKKIAKNNSNVDTATNTELANAQIASGNYGIQINDERVYFTNNKITRIDAGEFSFEYTLQGRKQFRHNGRVISREGVIKSIDKKKKNTIITFREFTQLDE